MHIYICIYSYATFSALPNIESMNNSNVSNLFDNKNIVNNIYNNNNSALLFLHYSGEIESVLE